MILKDEFLIGLSDADEYFEVRELVEDDFYHGSKLLDWKCPKGKGTEIHNFLFNGALTHNTNLRDMITYLVFDKT